MDEPLMKQAIDLRKEWPFESQACPRFKWQAFFQSIFLLKEKFIVTSHGDNHRYKGNNVYTTKLLIPWILNDCYKRNTFIYENQFNTWAHNSGFNTGCLLFWNVWRLTYAVSGALIVLTFQTTSGAGCNHLMHTI